jgi:hypothetical protein
MIVRRFERRSVVSAFPQYLFVSVIVVNIDLPHVAWWQEGWLISLALAVPVALILQSGERKAVPIILSTAVVLGTLIGVAGHCLK